MLAPLNARTLALFKCCWELGVILWLDKGDCYENVHIYCVRVKINKRSFEPFLCVDFVWDFPENVHIYCVSVSK